MSPLTALVFILVLGSLNCLEEPSIEEECMKQEGVTKNDFNQPNATEEMRVKCFYHCILENDGIIANGVYVGHHKWCKNVTDADKCELARKVISCSMLRNSF